MRPRLLAIVVFLILTSAGPASAGLTGVVTDVSAAAVEGAEVEIRSLSGTFVWTCRTESDGRFRWDAAKPGAYQIRVNGAGLDSREAVIQVSAASADTDIRIALQPRSVYTRITVSATRGAAEEAESSAQVAFTKDLEDIRKRPVATLGEAFAAEPGVMVQQSTTGQVSPFLRGLTGYQVLNLVDGIRFNNSTFRSGPNQYLAFIEPNQAQRVEALLGPSGAQYGSDSLGGTINVITSEPIFSSDDHRWATHGDAFFGGASADLSGFGNARFSVSSDRLFWLVGASGRKHNDLRSGSGHDSRNAFHRFFGMPFDSVQELLGSRLQDSGFRQYGVKTKLAFRLRADHLVTLNFLRGVQDQVRSYKDLLGGLGRLQSDFDPQILNWFYARYEKLRLGFLDSVTGTLSLNSQVDGSARRNLLYSDPLTRDWNRVDAWGYSGQAATHRSNRLLASFGGDVYDERVASERTVTEASGRVTRPRPLYPDRSRYQNVGVFGQTSLHLTSRLRASSGVRFTG
ncbi:MAG TPA: TonB-dependent receptor plug domain-containing protein, partial [Bryobacteraceae bacterium]|nr:TonB-dependent receptor plug domain-containing protein [Bryobacteraceae bacterium]